MSKQKQILIIFAILVIPVLYITFCNLPNRSSVSNNISFDTRLSYYQLFDGKMAELRPSSRVALFELSSTLFTDYAKKQRLIKLPKGRKIKLSGNSLPVFPEGSLIAKTFYYTMKNKKKKIIETRLLLLNKGNWNIAVYKWNLEQTEAFLITNGGVVQIESLKEGGESIRINYRIPTSKECVSCHQSQNAVLPIGPKTRNLNLQVMRAGAWVNQLQYLMNTGMVYTRTLKNVKRLPAYTDQGVKIEDRARGYLEINCAHCHRPGGDAGRTTLNVDYDTHMDKTAIKLNRNNILMRMSEMGAYHMPKLGTTVIDTAGLLLIRGFLKNLR